MLDSPDDPILELPFFKAQQLCHILGGRPPTWQEWESAARGEEGYLYPWGDRTHMDGLDLDAPQDWQFRMKATAPPAPTLEQRAGQWDIHRPVPGQ